MPTPAEILANAARLKASPAMSNVSQYDDVFQGGLENGHVPTAFEQQTGDAVADQAATALGAGPSISALMRLADERRLEHTNDLLAADTDMEAHGLNRAVMENQIGDVLSEGKARRSFLPWAAQREEENDQATMARAQLQYGLPAQIKAQGDFAAAQAQAQGRVDAAKAAHPVVDPISALREALLKRFQSGYAVTPDDVTQLQSVLPK